MIVVEGPDGAGKSRLARRLSEELNWPIAPRAVGPDTVPLVNMREWIEGNLALEFHRQIYDRHRLISEPIYGPWVRGEVGDDFKSRIELWNWWVKFRVINPVIIFCLPPLETVMQNLADDEDGHNERLRQEMPGIYWQYSCLAAQLSASWSNHNITVWDYTGHDFHSMVTWIVRGREMRGAMSSKLAT